jgi:hypothetical protein
VSFAHHVPGCEAQDLGFFRLARARYGFGVEPLEEVAMGHMFRGEGVTVPQFLYRLTKPEGEGGRPPVERQGPATAAGHGPGLGGGERLS